MRRRLLDLALPAVLGGAATTLAAALLEARPPGGHARYERENHAGHTVSLLGGAAAGAGATVAALAVPLSAPGAGRLAAAGALAAATGSAMGAVDDLAEADSTRKGLRGHLGALARGEVTTGALKIAGIGAGALAAAALATPRRDAAGTAGRLADTAVSAALIAATANLHNLLDLRPGRALKAAGLLSAPLALRSPGTPHGALAAGALGVAAAALPDDLNETTMLGDTGANGLGALVGTALAAHPSRALRAGALAGAVGLTLASERVSFSQVIEDTPALRCLDELGRRG